MAGGGCWNEGQMARAMDRPPAVPLASGADTGEELASGSLLGTQDPEYKRSAPWPVRLG